MARVSHQHQVMLTLHMPHHNDVVLGNSEELVVPTDVMDLFNGRARLYFGNKLHSRSTITGTKLRDCWYAKK